MKEEGKNDETEEKEIETGEEILDELTDDLDDEPNYVTREINLDDLYDGAINNTVVIDPITNNEVLLSNKKPNYTIIGVVVAIVVLLLLYYVNNKSDIGRTTKDVEPKTTTSTKITNESNDENGVLTCNYSSKSEAETQTVTFVANYENANITTTNFNFVVISNGETESAIVTDLKTQYENFFINNASLTSSNVSFEKNEKGFTFNVETDYKKTDFDDMNVVEGQTILYVKPGATDTIDSLKNTYTDKGFSCVLTNNTNEE